MVLNPPPKTNETNSKQTNKYIKYNYRIAVWQQSKTVEIYDDWMEMLLINV